MANGVAAAIRGSGALRVIIVSHLKFAFGLIVVVVIVVVVVVVVVVFVLGVGCLWVKQYWSVCL